MDSESQRLADEVKRAWQGKLDDATGSLDARLSELEQKAARRGSYGDSYGEPESWGQAVARSDEYKALASSPTQRGKVQISIKTTLTTGSTSGGPLAPTDRKPGPNLLPRRRIRFRDLLTPGRTDSTSVEYPRQTTRTNAAAPVAEGATKPESALAFEMVTAPTRTIAHLLPASRQILDDASMLRSIIDGELRYMLGDAEETQLLNGDGTGQNLNGIVSQATAFAAPFAVENATLIDVLLMAIAQVEAAGYEPDGICLNPLDWRQIQSMKTTDGSYLGSGPFSAEQVARLWTLPLVTTSAMATDNFLVTTSTAAQVFDRQHAVVEISTEHSDFFSRNLVMLRAEERLALAVYRPGAFVTGTFTAGLAA